MLAKPCARSPTKPPAASSWATASASATSSRTRSSTAAAAGPRRPRPGPRRRPAAPSAPLRTRGSPWRWSSPSVCPRGWPARPPSWVLACPWTCWATPRRPRSSLQQAAPACAGASWCRAKQAARRADGKQLSQRLVAVGAEPRRCTGSGSSRSSKLAAGSIPMQRHHPERRPAHCLPLDVSLHSGALAPCGGSWTGHYGACTPTGTECAAAQWFMSADAHRAARPHPAHDHCRARVHRTVCVAPNLPPDAVLWLSVCLHARPARVRACACRMLCQPEPVSPFYHLTWLAPLLFQPWVLFDLESPIPMRLPN